MMTDLQATALFILSNVFILVLICGFMALNDKLINITRKLTQLINIIDKGE